MLSLVKSYEFFKPEDCRSRVHIIGCGAIGSHIAEQLARYGVDHITLWDFDTVEPHNIANQLYVQSDLGKLKVDALAAHIREINPDVYLNLMPNGYSGQRLAGYIFLAVDNIDLRRQIAESNKNNAFIKAMFDFRMRLTDAQHYAADWSDKRMVENFLNTMQFSHEEAQAETPVSACNMTLSVCSTVKAIVSFGVSNFINFVKGNGIKKMILMDAFSYQVDAF